MPNHPDSPSALALWKSATATLVVAGVAAALAFAARSKDVRPESDQVVLEAAQFAGESPWTQPVTAPVDHSVTANTLDSTVAGDEPSLYGGSNELSVCDRKQLVSFLRSNPDQATAWSDVVCAPDVETYVDALTPVVLTTDTNVTNHGYSGGKAQPFQSALQAGTAMLIDSQGVPKVRCECGNPLAEPENDEQTATFVGDRWPEFDPALAVTIVPTPDVETTTDPAEQEEIPDGTEDYG